MGKASASHGFILSMAMMLVLVLTVSGMSFMQLDFLERRMALGQGDNHGAFYLASGGIERALASFKISPLQGSNPSWTPTLDPNHLAHPNNYPTDSSYPSDLCPDRLRGCVIPPFQTRASNPSIQANGDPISYVPGFSPALYAPLDALFSDGSYTVRAFNNLDFNGPDLADDDGVITLRAIGLVRGERKILQADIRAVSNLRHMNCVQDSNDPVGTGCPEVDSGSNTITTSPGKSPFRFPVPPGIPRPNPSLTNAGSYYRNPANFSSFIPNAQTINVKPANPLGGPCPHTLNVQSDTYYMITYDSRCWSSGRAVNIQGVAASNVLIFVDNGYIDLMNGVDLGDSILVASGSGTGGTGQVRLRGSLTLSAPVTYPAIMASQGVYHDDWNSHATIYGNIYSDRLINFGSNATVHGLLLSTDIELRGSSTFTDWDPNGNLPYYGSFMPGFSYPDDFKATVINGGSWQEVE